jgi:hypothetical protein
MNYGQFENGEGQWSRPRKMHGDSGPPAKQQTEKIMNDPKSFVEVLRSVCAVCDRRRSRLQG